MESEACSLALIPKVDETEENKNKELSPPDDVYDTKAELQSETVSGAQNAPKKKKRQRWRRHKKGHPSSNNNNDTLTTKITSNESIPPAVVPKPTSSCSQILNTRSESKTNAEESAEEKGQPSSGQNNVCPFKEDDSAYILQTTDEHFPGQIGESNEEEKESVNNSCSGGFVTSNVDIELILDDANPTQCDDDVDSNENRQVECMERGSFQVSAEAQGKDVEDCRMPEVHESTNTVNIIFRVGAAVFDNQQQGPVTNHDASTDILNVRSIPNLNPHTGFIHPSTEQLCEIKDALSNEHDLEKEPSLGELWTMDQNLNPEENKTPKVSDQCFHQIVNIPEMLSHLKNKSHFKSGGHQQQSSESEVALVAPYPSVESTNENLNCPVRETSTLPFHPFSLARVALVKRDHPELAIFAKTTVESIIACAQCELAFQDESQDFNEGLLESFHKQRYALGSQRLGIEPNLNGNTAMEESLSGETKELDLQSDLKNVEELQKDTPTKAPLCSSDNDSVEQTPIKPIVNWTIDPTIIQEAVNEPKIAKKETLIKSLTNCFKKKSKEDKAITKCKKQKATA